MGSLSNRVMNMKFMQSDDSGRKESDENGTKKIKDDSEWVSPYYQQYLTKVKPKNVEYIGYANINDLQSKEVQNSENINRGSGNPGRKVWGDNTNDERATLDISKLKDTISKDNKNKPKGNKADKAGNASQKVTSETETDVSGETDAQSKSEEFLDNIMGKGNKRDNSSVGGDKGKPGAKKKRKGGNKKTR